MSVNVYDEKTNQLIQIAGNPQGGETEVVVSTEKPTDGTLLWVNPEGESGSGGKTKASDISYNNSQSGLSAKNVQEAVDEIRDNVRGMFVLKKVLNGENKFEFQPDFTPMSSNANRQSVLIFGIANGSMVFAVIGLYGKDKAPETILKNGISSVVKNSDNQRVTVYLEQTAYDSFLLISPNKIGE